MSISFVPHSAVEQTDLMTGKTEVRLRWISFLAEDETGPVIVDALGRRMVVSVISLVITEEESVLVLGGVSASKVSMRDPFPSQLPLDDVWAALGELDAEIPPITTNTYGPISPLTLP